MFVTKTTTTIRQPSFHLKASPSESEETTSDAAPTSPAPVLNGKRVLPYKVIMPGLKGHNVAAVYAIMNKDYKRGQEGWEHCEHIGVSQFLDQTLTEMQEEHGPEKVAHIRAMTFVIPNEGAMEQIANDWRILCNEAGGHINFDPMIAAMELSIGYDDEDEDDDDDYAYDEEDDDDYMAMTAKAMSMARESKTNGEIEKEDDIIHSPFEGNNGTSEPEYEMPPQAASTKDGEKLEFNVENVDKVLDEIRPYLISDGGNCRVDSVDEQTRSVYLVLEGACGSCPSSTVTMQMGIERVLKENFENIGEVAQVLPDEEEKPTELTYTVVETEVNRIKPAIIAMGGMVEIVKVDPIGVVEIKFRGANKVRQGLELALLDIDFVKHVNFVSQD